MKVLVVDDNKNDRMLISIMLRVRGYDVLEARNGVEALRLLENVIPDLIISDINMPGMDGLTLLLRLKKNNKTNIIPFVFYTAVFVNDEDRELGLSLGASRYLLKPLEPKEFLLEIEAVLKEFKVGELKPNRPKITEEEYLEKYNQRISQMLESEIDRIEQEIDKRTIAEEALLEEIKERQKGEEQLRLASLYARSLIEASPDPLVTINRNGKITDVNKATEDVTGVARDQLIGTDFSNYFTKPDKAREGYKEVFLKGFVRDYPLAIRHTSGSITDVLYNATVYRNERGEVEGVFAATRDITERKKAEEQLRSASLYTRNLIEASLDPLVTISSDGKITDVNKATEDVTGVSRLKLIGSDFSNYFTEPDKARKGYKEVFLKGFVRDYPLAIRHTSGSITYVLYDATVYRNERGEVEGVFAAARDITERKKAQEAALQLAAIVESSDDAIISKTLDGIITSWNQGAEMIYGYSSDEIMGKPVSILVPFDIPDEMPHIFKRIKRGKLIEHFETVRVRKDGGRIHVSLTISPIKDASGKIIGASTIARDITDRKRNEEKLREASLYTRSLIEASYDPLVTIGSDGKIMDVNKATEQVTGFSRKKLIGTDFSDYFTEPESARKGYRQVFEKGFVKDYPLTIRHRSGSTTDVLYNATVYRNERGEVEGVFAAARDITERKRAEDAMKFAKEAAVRASSIKSEFLEKMSHELRTPLNAILGFNELLRMKTMGELNQKQEHYVNNISDSGKHLLGIINDMLDLVKVESGENLPLSIESFNAPEAIDQTLIFVQEKAVQKNVIIAKEIDPELNIISADKIRFKQILLNFLDNAIKFSKPQGGTVTIAARNVGDMAQFSVSDTGIGIREEEKGKLFSLFYQADSGRSRKYAGTGVGLAIIKQLVEQHHGILWVESKYGEGSTFTFTIPLSVNKKEENK